MLLETGDIGLSLAGSIDQSSTNFFTSSTTDTTNFQVARIQGSNDDNNGAFVNVLAITLSGFTSRTPAESVTQFVSQINSISTTTGTVISGRTFIRNCVATSNNDTLILTRLSNGNTTVTGSGNKGGTISVLNGLNTSNFNNITFEQDRQYIRRNGNNGWLVFTKATQEIVE